MAVHQRKEVVRRPDCRVELCSCGVYHVSLGAVTMRMTLAQLSSLFEALGVAIAPTLEGDEDGDPPVH